MSALYLLCPAHYPVQTAWCHKVHKASVQRKVTLQTEIVLCLTAVSSVTLQVVTWRRIKNESTQSRSNLFKSWHCDMGRYSELQYFNAAALSEIPFLKGQFVPEFAVSLKHIILMWKYNVHYPQGAWGLAIPAMSSIANVVQRALPYGHPEQPQTVFLPLPGEPRCCIQPPMDLNGCA